MDFIEYQRYCRETDIYPSSTRRICLTLGLCSEAGELAGVLKKAFRDNGGAVDMEKIKAELGDCLWYLARAIEEYGFSFEEIALANIAKLKARKENGTLNGDGDSR